MISKEVKAQTSSYRALLHLWFPELLTILLLFSALTLVDAKLISSLGSQEVYAVLGVSTSFFHFLVKTGESLMVFIIVIGGQFNGKQQFSAVGQTFVHSLWITVALSSLSVILISCFAATGLGAFQLEADTVALGAQYLSLKSVSIGLMFVFLSCMGFYRSIKQPKLPMMIFGIGAIVFIFFDIVLIKGLWGFPQLGLVGSSWASIIQYGLIDVIILGAIFRRQTREQYQIKWSAVPSLRQIREIFSNVVPIMIDKSSIMLSYLWLALMVSKISVVALATFTVLRDVMIFLAIPAQAAAQVIAYVTSNLVGESGGDYSKIKKPLTRLLRGTVLLMAVMYLFTIHYASDVFGFFDETNTYSAVAATLILPISLFVIFDVLQLLYAAMLRGAGQLKWVMWTRGIGAFCFFIPLSYYFVTHQSVTDAQAVMILYSLFYCSFLLQQFVHHYRFRYMIKTV